MLHLAVFCMSVVMTRVSEHTDSVCLSSLLLCAHAAPHALQHKDHFVQLLQPALLSITSWRSSFIFPCHSCWCSTLKICPCAGQAECIPQIYRSQWKTTMCHYHFCAASSLLVYNKIFQTNPGDKFQQKT